MSFTSCYTSHRFDSFFAYVNPPGRGSAETRSTTLCDGLVSIMSGTEGGVARLVFPIFFGILLCDLVSGCVFFPRVIPANKNALVVRS